MSAQSDESFLKGTDLHTEQNNADHHTAEISLERLIVRRGQPFTVTLQVSGPFKPEIDPFIIVAATGEQPSEERGTKSCVSVPDNVKRSPSAKAVWKVEVHDSSFLAMGILTLTIVPPADTPIGAWVLTLKHKGKEALLLEVVVLFNPWCPDDWVYMSDERERQEYVLNDQGVIFRGSAKHISPLSWDFGQFEDNMVDICLKILDLNIKHKKDPADDVSARCNPIYVGRVISAMINCQDDCGVLMGNWSGSYEGGRSPSHWSGSYAILKGWYNSEFSPVRYGQCWVFGGVMCAVMRLLGIPCRVVTNFNSAHDNNANVIIDKYYPDTDVEEVEDSGDSIWNYHVWTEGYMRRPDIAADGKYDGWQVLDPTPQEKSDGIYCCGPAPVKAILIGDTTVKYDLAFVFAEVNADCIDWLVKADNSKTKIWSDTKRVGKNISTKSVGSDKNWNITSTYKYREGSEKERDAVERAVSGEGPNSDASVQVSPPISMQFEEVGKLMNGKDVNLKLVLSSKSTAARSLSIQIVVQSRSYNDSGATRKKIQKELKEETLEPGKELSIPILVPFLAYNKHMLHCDAMRFSALVTDKDLPDEKYLVEDDIILPDPPITIDVPRRIKLNNQVKGEVVFENPIDQELTNCTLTISGSGLFREDIDLKLDNLGTSKRLRIQFYFSPHKCGEKTVMVDFDCSCFRDIKATCKVLVTV